MAAAERLPDRNLCVVAHSAGRTTLQQRAIPMPGPLQVLLRVEVVMVQQFDVMLAEGSIVAPSYPIVPGQDFCGTVVGIGTSVEPGIVKLGDRVAVEPRTFCSRCYYCDRGQTNLCETSTLTGWNVDGGYTQYATVHHCMIHTFNEDVSWRQAVLTSAAAAASYGMTKANILPGDSILIIGNSVCSLMGIVFARGLGANFIMVVGKGSQLQAMNCGAGKFVVWDRSGDAAAQTQAIQAIVMESTEGRGVDCVMFPSDHSSGVPEIHLAHKVVRPGGCIVSVRPWEGDVIDAVRGYSEGEAVAGHAGDIVAGLLHKDLRLISVEGCSSALFKQALRWIEGGLLLTWPDVQQRMPLNAWEQAHNMLKNGEYPYFLLFPQVEMIPGASGTLSDNFPLHVVGRDI